MSFEQLHELCLSLPGASFDHPFGPEVRTWRVGDKLFALAGLDNDPVRVNLKCEPLLAEQLRAEWAQVEPGYHMNKRHWNTVTLDAGLPRQLLTELVEDSYDLVRESLPAAVRKALDARG